MAQLHDIDVEQYLRDCVDIDDTALNEEFIRVPADLAYWNHQFAEAVQELAQSKFVREQVYARRRAEVRDELMQAARDAYDTAMDMATTPAEEKKIKLKAPTVDDIDSATVVDEEYAEAKQREIDAEGAKARMYGIVDAVRTKRDMLIQMGADRRVEMQGDPQLRAEAKGAREARS